MTFDTYFRATSYATIAAGALALAVSGGMSILLFLGFVALLVGAWNSEGRRWQLSERTGLVVVIVSLPLFYLNWKLQANFTSGREQQTAAISVLVQFTLFLSSVKLLQLKADRDWLFLYLISFFEVLLAAGLSVSPFFVGTLGLYMFSALLTIVCFELKKARANVPVGEARLLVAHDANLLRRLRGPKRKTRVLRRLPLAALALLALIFALALPIFFITPRFGESSALTLAAGGGGINGFVGFSDRVTLGEIGRLQQSDRIVMRVRVEEPEAERNRNLRWRGVALDYFSGRAWTRSNDASEIIRGNERDLYQLGTTQNLNRVTTQTFFLEAIDTPVLFVAPRAVAVQGALPYLRRDDEGALTTRQHPQERLSYRAYSDTVEPPAQTLQQDGDDYPPGMRRYLQLPRKLDPRIGALTSEVLARAGAHDRYTAARAVEAHLNNDYGYTLEMRAGGQDPLADFLFRVRAGHCEYFSTAMVVMLRTHGVAARVVNGFQTGEYNDAANAYTVKQSNAHSWVEVYFPQTDAWVTFDPTPPAGRNIGASTGGLGAQLNKYAEALELFWIQYVVAYDKQEQRTLANSFRRRWREYREAFGMSTEALTATIRAWWVSSPADEGASGKGSLWRAAGVVFALAVGVALLLLFVRRYRRRLFGRAASPVAEFGRNDSEISFYRRMIAALEARGLRRAADQTPLEFAAATGMPEAMLITRAYHRVRYGAQKLSTNEAAEIEQYLRQVEKAGE
ncbi:MAG TPA: DUF3488 and transglutaminase-like domain-containing protein [Pyrinomonadaceae bacterium]|nr:DUF3488 and transglutaminase-like domain-containing protein [Pyrinomonadaceae bacterium]